MASLMPRGTFLISPARSALAGATSLMVPIFVLRCQPSPSRAIDPGGDRIKETRVSQKGKKGGSVEPGALREAS